MVALEATWYGLKRPYFFQQGQHLNDQTYHDKLLPFYQNEGNELFGHKNYWFQQDGGSSHTDQRLSNSVGRTLNSLFQRTDDHLTHLN